MKKINYFSSDKMYTIKSKKLDYKKNHLLHIITILIMTICSIFCFVHSIRYDNVQKMAKYSEKGNADYTVYLKENNHYDSAYLKSGMQYIASLINAINIDYNYVINSESNANYNYKYKITGLLEITDRDDHNKVLYTKKETLLDTVNEKITSNKLLINESISIDYNKYNDYVASYKRDYGVVVDSNLTVTLEVETIGKFENVKEDIKKKSEMKVIIPLSEQTMSISIDTPEISNNENLLIKKKLHFNNYIVLFLGVFFLLGLLSTTIDDVVLVSKHNKDNIYRNTINKILREYDNLIISGKVSIDEATYNNKVYPENFDEMIDAAVNLNVPILYYEVIPNEKCFFIIINNDTLYKFRLTKAFLENERHKESRR